ncbi:MAG: hypothetical protein JWR01_1522 [Subtercola sp.]|nr:hypothetical protein [Subtercola sp.]
MAETESDPFHDFTVPQDADLVAAPTPNAESTGNSDAESDDPKLDDDPLGADHG